MASDKPAQDAFLAAIEAKIAAWQAVAASYRAAVSLDGPVGEPGAVVSGAMHAAGTSRVQLHGEGGLPIGVFRDKTVKEAILIYLGAGHRKQTNKEITIGLQKGGIATTSRNFEPTVATALYRLKAEGLVLRFDDGWDLASSYPESLRGRLEKDKKPARRPTKKATRASSRKLKAAASPAEPTALPAPRDASSDSKLALAG